MLDSCMDWQSADEATDMRIIVWLRSLSLHALHGIVLQNVADLFVRACRDAAASTLLTDLTQLLLTCAASSGGELPNYLKLHILPRLSIPPGLQVCQIIKVVLPAEAFMNYAHCCSLALPRQLYAVHLRHLVEGRRQGPVACRRALSGTWQRERRAPSS